VGESVEGVGGVFFRSSDPDALRAWYAAHLGIEMEDYGTTFTAKDGDRTVWAPFPADTGYFGRNEQQLMVNFRVRDLDAMLAQLHAAGIDPDDEVVEAAGIGRFAHIQDPAGTRLELWEPPADT
jgi:predicted enzyme related to lactoylglutathione lyase